jgi:MYXO-CTERM domain-containing protein
LTGTPLADTGITHNFSMLVTRVGADELSFSLSWTNPGGTAVYSFNSYNETNGVIDLEGDPATTDVWNGGNVNQFDGFSILLHDDAPFSPADPGSYIISNFNVTGTAVPEPTGAMLALLAGFGLAFRRRR